MNLPTTRNTSYGAESPIKSADINALQDCITGKKKPNGPRVIYPIPLSLQNLAWTVPGGVNAPYWLSSGAGTSYFGLAGIEEGDRITQFTVNVFGDGAVDVSHILKVVSAAQVMADFANQSDNNRAAAWGDFSPAPSAGAHTMAAGESLLYIVAPNAANFRLGGSIRLYYDRL